MKAIDLTGSRFGRLVAIERGDPHTSPSRKQVTWVCRCDCGNTVTVQRGSLRAGTTTSCGCSYADGGKRKRTERYENRSEYTSWSLLRDRCKNRNNKEWKNYGGRGIKVCRQWDESFSVFFSDMGKKPSPHHSIDRINVDGDYEPKNCRWATNHQQSRNRRNNRVIDFNGETYVLADWAARIGISPASLDERLRRKSKNVALTLAKGMRHGA